MDKETTLSLLRLSAAAIAICLSVLLWYTKHFIDTLRDAESKGMANRLSLARSPRIFAIIFGVAFVLLGGGLSVSVFWQSVSSSIVTVPLWSRGFWLIILCFAAPLIGAFIVAIVAIGQIGWLEGLCGAVNHLLPRRRKKPLDLAAGLDAVVTVQALAFDTGLEVDNAILANWTTSERWVRTNEKKWGLGKGFLRANAKVLAQVVDYERQQLARRESPSDIRKLEAAVSSLLEHALESTGAIDAVILNRPRQIACVYIYL
jgi:hypothetical protein